MSPNNILVAVIACVFVWRIYIRLRRNFGRQPIYPKRLIIRIVILSVVACLLLAFSIFNPRLLMGLAAGLVAGMLAALGGLSLTRFEATPEGRFYTPNSYIGGVLGVLLVGRLVYRLMAISNMSQTSPQTPALMQSALSLSVFGLLTGYYIVYFIGVLVQSRSVQV